MKKRNCKEVVVRNVGDLISVINENAESLGRQIQRITKTKRHLTILSGIVVGLAISYECQRQKLEEQVYNLSVRVKKLENDKED